MDQEWDRPPERAESLFYSSLGDELKLKEDNIDGISRESAHRPGKRNVNGKKPRPIIAKFSFYKNKEFILSNVLILAGTVFGISQDFPQEIVEVRRGLVKVLKEAKKEGSDAKLVYDKLYINGQRYIPRS